MRCAVGLVGGLVLATLSGRGVAAGERAEGAHSLQSAELYNTAQTLPAGRVVLHPVFFPSTVGLTERVDVKVPILMLFDGPSVEVEVAAWESSGLAVSVAPFLRSVPPKKDGVSADGWGQDIAWSGARVLSTVPTGKHRLNVGTGVLRDHSRSVWAAPVEVGADLVVSAHTTIQLGMGSNLSRTAAGDPNLATLATWNRAWGRYRLSLGAQAMLGEPGDAGSLFAPAALQPDDERGSLSPHIAMWWRLGDKRTAAGAPGPTATQETAPWHWSAPGTAPPSLRQPRWSAGVSTGLGVRILDPQQIPTGAAPRLDLLVIEARRALAENAEPGLRPARLDLQVDWAHATFSGMGTRWPRLPVSAYLSWLQPLGERSSLSLAPGLYTETGVDRFVVNEQLEKGLAGTVALAGRVGWERHAQRVDSGLYLRGAGGLSMGQDPDHPARSRYLRIGLENTWTWGRKVDRGAP